MIRPVTREAVFSRSRLADYYISDTQRFYYNPDIKSGMDNEDGEPESIIPDDSRSDEGTGGKDNQYSYEEGSLIKDVADHLIPFHKEGRLTDDFAVLGYPRKTAEYVANRSKAMIRFFEIMNIRRLYLMDEMRYDWLRFPFKDKKKLAAFKNLVNIPSYREAFEMDTADLSFVLPLFTNSGRYNTAIIVLFSADDEVPIAMYLCDDGNFHTSFRAEDRERIFYAASAAGLVMGGTEVCSLMYKV